jgi:D-alanyl-D-alanine carboxypeptidase/D-alanyl-D-alanine-endopeptidase (penicillin-binding protein 4)
MKYLEDSLVGMRYIENADSIIFQPAGDPTFLQADFKNQPAFTYLKQKNKNISFRANSQDNFEALGYGWAWDDYESSYMAERSSLPIYGNIATFQLVDKKLQSVPADFADNLFMAIPADEKFELHRDQHANKFYLSKTNTIFKTQELPFKTGKSGTAMDFLLKTFGVERSAFQLLPGILPGSSKLFSQPKDSLFKPMMHRSDNFFAEQTLLMASNEFLGYMSDRNMIDTILKTDLKDLPQKPRWVDGSGLSRYNLFTPQDFIFLLNKIKKEYDWERIKNILPTGGEGTLSSYYKADAGFIYAKTGTLSNNCALSGYLITKKNKVLIFSVLVNNYGTGATPVRRAVEKFIKDIREHY